jgi:LruC domain-containing protein
VIDYEVDHILNGNNLLVDIEADWTIKAVFAGYKNGFGIHFENLDPSEIASVSGTNMSENIITQNANGTEDNQDDATVIIFDNVFTAVQSSGSPFPHTSPTTTISSTINMSNPVSQSSTGLPPYNAFIFANGNRHTEVHLPGKKPTDLASHLLFGTFADATDTASDYYYKTSNGLPWAIHLPEPFDFPNESTPINQAYSFFTAWATSGGNSNADWYLDLPGYRDSSKIFD